MNHTTSSAPTITAFALIVLLSILRIDGATIRGSSRAQHPIFVLSLPKSGTTSVHKFFDCGGYNSVHHRHGRNALEVWGSHFLDRDLGELVGKCLQQNIQNGRLPLQDCGRHQVWTDIAYTEPDQCFFPAHHDNALEALYQAYPKATWLLTTRNETDWYHSLSNFLGGKILHKWNHCFGNEAPQDAQASQEYWTHFYLDYTARIDKFAKDHPSLQYIHLSMDDQDATNILSQQFEVPSSCRGHHRTTKHPWNQIVDAMETNLLLWNQS